MIRALAPLLALPLVTAGCTADLDVGEHEAPIVRGDESASGSHPATVYLWLGNSTCSGTLIAPQVVLTAEHCVAGKDVEDIGVYFGENPREDNDGTWVDATGYEAHNSGDIAVVYIARPGPADPIPFRRTQLQSWDMGRDVQIVGFGLDASNGTSGVKREGMTVLADMSGDILWVGDEGSKTCSGDSGGPTFIYAGGQKYVIGVSSFITNGDDCHDGISGNVRTDYYAQWLDEQVAKAGEASCAADGQCAQGCDDIDPDCPCDPTDGVCSATCDNYVLNDPDCFSCAQDGVCREDGCPELDLDCCGEDNQCNRTCIDPDPDCGQLGDSCGNAAECLSETCGSVGDNSRCTQECDATANPCPAGFACLDGGACWPEPGGCAAQNQSPWGPFVGVMLVFGMLFGVRRTRRG